MKLNLEGLFPPNRNQRKHTGPDRTSHSKKNTELPELFGVLPQGAHLKIRSESAKTAKRAIAAMDGAGFNTPLTEKRAICYKCGDAKHIVLFSEALSDQNAGDGTVRQNQLEPGRAVS